MRSRCIFFQQDDLPRFSMASFARTPVAAPGGEGEPILTEPIKVVRRNSVCLPSVYGRSMPSDWMLSWPGSCVDCDLHH